MIHRTDSTERLERYTPKQIGKLHSQHKLNMLKAFYACQYVLQIGFSRTKIVALHSSISMTTKLLVNMSAQVTELGQYGT